MKKTLSRLMSAVLVAVMLCGIFATTASASNDINGLSIKKRYTVDGTGTQPELFTMDELKDIASRYAYKIKGYVTDLDKLAPYMSHVPASANACKVNSQTKTVGSNAVQLYSTLEAAQHAFDIQTDGLAAYMNNVVVEQNAGKVQIGPGLVTECTGSSVGGYVNGKAPTEQTVTNTSILNLTSVPSMWLSNSMQGDQTVKHILMANETFYYGENTFRNSALETVIFPWNLFSDHVIDSNNNGYPVIENARRTLAGLATGKEAIIIAKNSFADCTRLKSVIFPTEPARLYLEDGVFANCPQLTVYAPAGGYLEDYCATHGIKFQAIENGYIEPKVDAVPTLKVIDHYEYYNDGKPLKDILQAQWFCAYLTHKPVAGYEPDFPNARVMPTDPRASGVTHFMDCQIEDLQRLPGDVNRYRDDAARQFTQDHLVRCNGLPTAMRAYKQTTLTPDQIAVRELLKQWIRDPDGTPAASEVTQPVTPSTPTFTDVAVGIWYADPVSWAVSNGITTGTSKTTFTPERTCTVSEILTFLYRAEGSPDVSIDNPFSDVSTSDFYYKPALWAYENSLVPGGQFNGLAPCTRAMVVEYLWQLAGSPGAADNQFADETDAADSRFSDVPDAAAYAQAVVWAVDLGITNGTSKTTFSPGNTCTRAEIVTFLFRAYA